MPAAPANRQMKLFGARNTSGYDAVPKDVSSERSRLP
jgi:hypothetical protein